MFLVLLRLRMWPTDAFPLVWLRFIFTGIVAEGVGARLSVHRENVSAERRVARVDGQTAFVETVVVSAAADTGAAARLKIERTEMAGPSDIPRHLANKKNSRH